MKEPMYLWKVISQVPGHRVYECYVVAESAPSAEKRFTESFKLGSIKHVEYISSQILIKKAREVRA